MLNPVDVMLITVDLMLNPEDVMPKTVDIMLKEAKKSGHLAAFEHRTRFFKALEAQGRLAAPDR